MELFISERIDAAAVCVNQISIQMLFILSASLIFMFRLKNLWNLSLQSILKNFSRFQKSHLRRNAIFLKRRRYQWFCICVRISSITGNPVPYANLTTYVSYLNYSKALANKTSFNTSVVNRTNFAARQSSVATNVAVQDLSKAIKGLDLNITFSPTISNNTAFPSPVLIVTPIRGTRFPSKSYAPSIYKSLPPSTFPTISPTQRVRTSTEIQKFSQTYVGPDLKRMTQDQIEGYEVIFTLMTQNYGPNGGEPNVTTKCTVLNQELSFARRTRSLWVRLLQDFPTSTTYLEVDFEMMWTSNITNVSVPSYVNAFVNYMNSEEGKNFTQENLVNLGVPVEEVENVRLQVSTPEPAALFSQSPSLVPSILNVSMMPTLMIQPTPTDDSNTRLTNAVIGVVATVVAVGMIICGGFFFQKRNRQKQDLAPAPMVFLNHHSDGNINYNTTSRRIVIPADEASLISEGNSLSSDASSILPNKASVEIDPKFTKSSKLQIIENTGSIEVREDLVLNSLVNSNYFDDDIGGVADVITDLKWGVASKNTQLHPTEIEVSVLCETNDWLKRKEGANISERRIFLQETMNKMVNSVRMDIISPDDATRTIHGCAAMLGLQLEQEFAETTLIITGMRKTVTQEDVLESFKEFGEIEDAAVAPRSRGFGLVRYASPKSVQRAMDKFRKEEIVVQDVAVVVRVLSANMTSIENIPLENDNNVQVTPNENTNGQRKPHPTPKVGLISEHPSDMDSIGPLVGSLGKVGGSNSSLIRNNNAAHSRNPSNATNSSGGNNSSGNMSNGRATPRIPPSNPQLT